MEGNDCYKFSTIKNYVARFGHDPVSRILDVGANIGAIALLAHEYFPTARIIGFEMVDEYWRRAKQATAHIPQITILPQALSYRHLYEDDYGERPRSTACALRVLKGLPSSGPGWIGGSQALPPEQVNGSTVPAGYSLLEESVSAITLEDVLASTGWSEIDILKLDCEGSEHSILGSAPVQTLKRIRYIVGEYHGLDRFYTTMQRKLFQTHKVNLVGSHDLGSFFAERLQGKRDGLLRWDKSGMRIKRPWLSERLIDWHLFDERHVLPAERRAHGFPD